MLFQQGLEQELGPVKRMATDKGYVGSFPLLTWVPDGKESTERSGKTARGRLRHETCNKCLKHWNILDSPT
jgi:hypothetical protein